jgi:hypothetical protein
MDHRDARALGGADDASNKVPETWEANSRKAGFEGNLLKGLTRYGKALLSRGKAEQVLQGERETIINDVHARPIDPALLDTLPNQEN